MIPSSPNRRRRALGLLGVCAVALLPASALLARGSDPAGPTLCMLRGEEIKDAAKAAGKTTVNNKTYYLCCKGCVTALAKMDDATKAKKAHLTDLRTEKIVLQRKLDAVNAELTTLEKPAAPAAKTAKADAKTAAAKTVYCAVTDEEIGTADQAVGGSSVYNGKTYYFCCAGCKPKFDGEPAKFASLADKAEAKHAAAH